MCELFTACVLFLYEKGLNRIGMYLFKIFGWAAIKILPFTVNGTGTILNKGVVSWVAFSVQNFFYGLENAVNQGNATHETRLAISGRNG